MATNETYDENEFFKTPAGHCKYNEKCKGCIYDCKQSYKVDLLSCSKYSPKPRKKEQAQPVEPAAPSTDAAAVEVKPKKTAPKKSSKKDSKKK